MFTEKEIAYIRSQPLGRIATIDQEGQPDNVAIGFQFDGNAFYISGLDNPVHAQIQKCCQRLQKGGLAD